MLLLELYLIIASVLEHRLSFLLDMQQCLTASNLSQAGVLLLLLILTHLMAVVTLKQFREPCLIQVLHSDQQSRLIVEILMVLYYQTTCH